MELVHATITNLSAPTPAPTVPVQFNPNEYGIDRGASYAELPVPGDSLRGAVTVWLQSYRSVEVQLRELRRSSPDRTRMRVVREGETLDRIANEAYGNPRLWRAIAEANHIDHPRFVAPGTPLVI